MTRLPALLLLLLLAAVSLTACAKPTRWHKSGVEPRQAAADASACRSWASREAEREIAGDTLFMDSTDLRRSSSGGAQMLQFSVKKQHARLTAQCMRQRGYSKTKK